MQSSVLTHGCSCMSPCFAEGWSGFSVVLVPLLTCVNGWLMDAGLWQVPAAWPWTQKHCLKMLKLQFGLFVLLLTALTTIDQNTEKKIQVLFSSGWFKAAAALFPSSAPVNAQAHRDEGRRGAHSFAIFLWSHSSQESFDTLMLAVTSCLRCVLEQFCEAPSSITIISLFSRPQGTKLLAESAEESDRSWGLCPEIWLTGKFPSSAMQIHFWCPQHHATVHACKGWA